ncbi:hypothetical protein GOBAR_DD06656 [Gossypium barbadense]|nr:hypothetical protein GOBAR_DD06656 [Gossypium barbadense]
MITIFCLRFLTESNFAVNDLVTEALAATESFLGLQKPTFYLIQAQSQWENMFVKPTASTIADCADVSSATAGMNCKSIGTPAVATFLDSLLSGPAKAVSTGTKLGNVRIWSRKSLAGDSLRLLA